MLSNVCSHHSPMSLLSTSLYRVLRSLARSRISVKSEALAYPINCVATDSSFCFCSALLIVCPSTTGSSLPGCTAPPPLLDEPPSSPQATNETDTTTPIRSADAKLIKLFLMLFIILVSLLCKDTEKAQHSKTRMLRDMDYFQNIWLNYSKKSRFL